MKGAISLKNKYNGFTYEGMLYNGENALQVVEYFGDSFFKEENGSIFQKWYYTNECLYRLRSNGVKLMHLTAVPVNTFILKHKYSDPQIWKEISVEACFYTNRQLKTN